MKGFRRVFQSLHSANFKYYFWGQLVSLLGSWMQQVALVTLVYGLRESAFDLGLIAFCSQIPILLLGLAGGSVADHFVPLNVMRFCQGLALLQSVALAVIALYGWESLNVLVFMALTLGCIQAIEIPSRHAVVASLVSKSMIPNAVALNSGIFNMARFAGPAIAGVLVVLIGEAWLFFLNALSFLFVLLALSRIQVAKLFIGGHQKKSGVTQGVSFVWHHQSIRLVFLMLIAAGVVGAAAIVLLPVVVDEVFHGGSELFGGMLACAGAGSLLAAFRLAYHAEDSGFERRIGLMAMLLGVWVMMLAWSDWLWLSCLLIMATGFTVSTLVGSANTYVQLTVPDAFRGRAMALFSMVYIGCAPVGNLFAGMVSESVGVMVALFIWGLGALLLSLLYWLLRWRMIV